jgi:CHAT domain-containing protein/Tfp pilus assembly protein PilF
MNDRLRSWSILLLATCVVTTGSRCAQLNPGIVIESIAKYSEGEKAGLQEGDVLLDWHRDDAQGEIASPFDLSEIEVEQAPRGVVTVGGVRGTEKRVWVLGQARWGVDARPNLPEGLLTLYLEGQKLAKARKLQDAVGRWRLAADTAKESPSNWLPSWFLFKAGELLASAEQWNQADAPYEEAIQRAALAVPEIRVHLLRSWARTFLQRGDWSNADRHYQQAAEESRRLIPESLTLADALDNLAYSAFVPGNLERSEKYRLQALAIREKLAPASLALARNLYNVGHLAEVQGDLAKASNYYDQGFAIQEKLDPEGIDLANSLTGLGRVARLRGDLGKAEQSYGQALAVVKKLSPDNMAVAANLTNLGDVARDRGALAKAEDYYRRGLAIWEKWAPDSLLVAANLNHLGSVVLDRGDPKRAEEYYRKALAIEQRTAPGGEGVAWSLESLGLVAQSRGDLNKADEFYHQSLAVEEKIAPRSLGVAASLNNLGDLALDRHDLDKAEEYLRQALAIGEKSAPDSLSVATSFNNLGNVARDRGDLAKAEQYYRQGQVIWEKLAPEGKEYAGILAALARIKVQEQQLDAAAALFENALNALEGQITNLGGGEAARSIFRGDHGAYYRDYVDLLMRQNQQERAFEVAESSRARTMLETLTAAHADVRRGVDAGLLERQRSLQADINAKMGRRIRLQTGQHRNQELAQVKGEIDALLAQYKDVQDQIRSTSPGYAALTQPEPLRAKEIQERLLDDESVLLEYSLGVERSYVWAVRQNSLVAYELPKRMEIESAARKVYNLLAARNSRPKATGVELHPRSAKGAAGYSEAARDLSRMVLGPVAAEIDGKRLVIVADGALQFIPFPSLPEPKAVASDGTSRAPAPLIVGHEIVNLPSASVLAELRREKDGRKEAAKAVAVLADPVFDRDDARVIATSGAHKLNRFSTRGSNTQNNQDESDQAAQSGDRLTRSVNDVRLSSDTGRLPRLRFTRQEAQAIMAVTPKGSGLTALDFQASRETAASPEIARYRIVHFATHGLLDNEHPELSGLVLSLVDEHGRRKNGFLDLEDIYNMNLPAELVVLSACQTGLGKDIQGEGLIGLTRGFMYAGASRVVASLWNVDDVATAELMGRFYTGMEKDGLRPAAALRQAQIQMWKQKDWSAPYYWAAFQMQGEWK